MSSIIDINKIMFYSLNMDSTTLHLVLKLRGLNQSDLAKKVGLSRQAISLWFLHSKTVPINVQSKHLYRLCNKLGLTVELLAQPLPLMSDDKIRRKLEATFLWDKLFPGLEDFGIALVQKDLRAIARLVQMEGLFKASQILGKSIWKKFHLYKKWMLPIRAQECEKIWNLQKNLKLI